MITCRQVVERANDFIERHLRLRARLEILLHIAMCRGCRAYLEQLRLTLRALRSLPQAALAGPEREALLRLYREHRRGEAR